MPSSASPERKQILASVRRRDRFHARRRRYGRRDSPRAGNLREPIREKYFYPDQYSNPANPAAHYATTAPEIWAADARRDHAFRRGSGHERDVRRDHAPTERIESGDSMHQFSAGFRFHGLEGLKHMADGDRAGDLRREGRRSRIFPCRTEDGPASGEAPGARRGDSRGRQFGRGVVGLLGSRAEVAARTSEPSSSRYFRTRAKNI